MTLCPEIPFHQGAGGGGDTVPPHTFHRTLSIYVKNVR
jgi:hypothetical protein